MTLTNSSRFTESIQLTKLCNQGVFAFSGGLQIPLQRERGSAWEHPNPRELENSPAVLSPGAGWEADVSNDNKHVVGQGNSVFTDRNGSACLPFTKNRFTSSLFIQYVAQNYIPLKTYCLDISSSKQIYWVQRPWQASKLLSLILDRMRLSWRRGLNTYIKGLALCQAHSRRAVHGATASTNPKAARKQRQTVSKRIL